MAFDLVQYFAEQIKSQKPQLLSHYETQEKNEYINEINTLTLGKLISLWRNDDIKTYQEIQTQDPLYIQEIARHLTTSEHNQSKLNKNDLEKACTDFLTFQFAELKQLDETGHYGKNGIRELLLGQIEHLSGQAKDWVWLTNDLTELIGTQPISQEELSLDETMKEFNQMVNSQVMNKKLDDQITTHAPSVTEPTWAKILEPIVAFLVLTVLYYAFKSIFA
ncbi:hypothetical protein [Acinetobacter sp. ANC 4648]|uniref:hypothetical protein n=1 Tax=Acinetobacter sp. ANC 4648 TaxID=1977875 RepID=UPI000A3593E2|nr:hypothetical protein [Acinetobacter sp. ANC 4648]OTG80057.1 hypothetical protein B9T27_13905 [Acinetobacter sp. ANC 4648]